MKRILIVRASAIGDVVFASPFAAALKRTWPEAQVSWLVEPGIAPLIADDPCIDELIHWPKGEWKALWQARRFGALFGAIRDFRRQLRARRFDVAIDLQSLLKSGLLTWLSGAPRRIGLGSREGSQWLMTEVVPKGGDAGRISSEYLYLAEQLGLDTGEFLPRLVVGEVTAHQTEALLAQHGLARGGYAVFAPFTTRPQKHWFEDAWQALGPKVAAELGLTPVILGGPADVDAARRIAGAIPGAVVLAGQTNLPQAAALIERAALLIGVDTGLTHMGTAFATPTVALFGSTRPYLSTGRANGRVIWLGLECSPCRRNPTCHGAFTCLREITPERVLDEARSALAEPRP
ncbi:glycosyltransferase family 9 protein [Nitrogeniibacter mangrovi]|uniref:Glycosyltransferase family 9 protein n=1 Tax=Nitrogeniibacter mangrovi TaxID=2016596 RepID=A0A6C1AZW1_9RHOO|nr:glycosyltransferase family 9 protein [Nitrogeniibacter mangrovi]QID16663.1 glycosyltransferase family 9 protein [Nitrogeniibacter mangrovi]